MEHENVYQLSERYAPPKTDLRGARIMDDYGNESWATHPIDHKSPRDVSREDLDAYSDVFAFMEFSDLLFYLYPVAKEYAIDNEINCSDSYMYSLNRYVEKHVAKLDTFDRNALLEGLQWIWDAGSIGMADWIQCPKLQKLIGVSASWDDLK